MSKLMEVCHGQRRSIMPASAQGALETNMAAAGSRSASLRFSMATPVREALAGLPAFRGCSPGLPATVCDRAARRRVAEGEILELLDGGPLLVLESGALRCTVGPGPTVTLGPGCIFNFVGMMGVNHEANPFKPTGGSPPKDDREDQKAIRQIRKLGPYEAAIFDGQPPPMIFTERRRNQQGSIATQLDQASSNDLICFYNLCPMAAGRAAPAAASPAGWLRVQLVGAPASAALAPAAPTRSPSEACAAGATVLEVPFDLIEEVGAAMGDLSEEGAERRQGLALFKTNCAALIDAWRILMSRCSGVFAGAPPEVIWAVSEASERRVMEAGEVIVQEGEGGEAAESLLLLEEGSAVVEKAVVGSCGRPAVSAIGGLGPGALIGELCLVGAGLARAATVRASSRVEVLVMPAHVLLSVLRRFPGLLAGVEHRCKEVGSFLVTLLPPRLDGLLALDVFAGCDLAFMNEVARHGERHIFCAGQTVMEPGRIDRKGTLYVVEYGSCTSEAGGRVEDVPNGSCFGDRTILGLHVAKEATVWVQTPLAVMLLVGDQALREAVMRHYGSRMPFDELSLFRPGRSLVRLASPIRVFSGCGAAFVERLVASSETRTYMLGQTICVEGGTDTRLVMLRSGATGQERTGRRLAEPSQAVVFGELAMLGAAHRHLMTVRAESLCFTLEIWRAAFVSAIDEYPEERPHFEEYAVQALSEGSEEAAVARWPFLMSAPPRLLYLLDLFAGRRFCLAGDSSLDDPETQGSAILVVHGTAVVLGVNGEEVEVLHAGGCYNEKILLGLDRNHNEHVEPRNYCEVQILSSAVWQKVLTEFPKHQETVRTGLATCMASRAAKQLGVTLNSPDILRMSPLMRISRAALVESLSEHLESHFVLPDHPLCVEGKTCDHMCILLSGTAVADQSGGCNRQEEISAGRVLGEAALLGITHVHARTIRARTLCIAQHLPRRFFGDAMQRSDADRDIFAAILRAVKSQGGQRLSQKLQRTAVFSASPLPFLQALSEHAEDGFYGPGDAVIQFGDPCFFGESSLYVLLAGRAVVEDALGVAMNHLGPSDVFGEAGALGFTATRIATVRASGKGALHCAVIVGPTLETALRNFPEEREALEAMLEHRKAKNEEFVTRRTAWLSGTVLPALERCPIFAGYPKEFLSSLAAPLTEIVCEAGEAIATAGDAAESMLVLLDGGAEVEARTGAKLGRLAVGASFGEVAVLGILATRPSTVRALSTCHVLVITAAALSRALDGPDARGARVACERIRASREEQVRAGLPMLALPIAVPRDCLCARAIAVQAERISLEPGHVWRPVPETDPCGQHLGILARGRAVLEMLAPGAAPHWVMPLNPGSLIMEGLAAEYSTHIRAVSGCEAYRVRQTDLNASVGSVPAAHQWFPRFKMYEMYSKQFFQERCNSVRGIIHGLAPHPCDDGIHQWGERRKCAVGRMSIARDFGWMLPRAPLAEAPPSRPHTTDVCRRRSTTDFLHLRRPASHAKSWAGDRPGGLSASASAGSLRLPRLRKLNTTV